MAEQARGMNTVEMIRPPSARRRAGSLREGGHGVSTAAASFQIVRPRLHDRLASRDTTTFVGCRVVAALLPRLRRAGRPARA